MKRPRKQFAIVVFLANEDPVDGTGIGPARFSAVRARPWPFDTILRPTCLTDIAEHPTLQICVVVDVDEVLFDSARSAAIRIAKTQKFWARGPIFGQFFWQFHSWAPHIKKTFHRSITPGPSQAHWALI